MEANAPSDEDSENPNQSHQTSSESCMDVEATIPKVVAGTSGPSSSRTAGANVEEPIQPQTSTNGRAADHVCDGAEAESSQSFTMEPAWIQEGIESNLDPSITEEQFNDSYERLYQSYMQQRTDQEKLAEERRTSLFFSPRRREIMENTDEISISGWLKYTLPTEAEFLSRVAENPEVAATPPAQDVRPYSLSVGNIFEPEVEMWRRALAAGIRIYGIARKSLTACNHSSFDEEHELRMRFAGDLLPILRNLKKGIDRCDARMKKALQDRKQSVADSLAEDDTNKNISIINTDDSSSDPEVPDIEPDTDAPMLPGSSRGATGRDVNTHKNVRESGSGAKVAQSMDLECNAPRKELGAVPKIRKVDGKDAGRIVPDVPSIEPTAGTSKRLVRADAVQDDDSVTMEMDAGTSTQLRRDGSGEAETVSSSSGTSDPEKDAMHPNVDSSTPESMDTTDLTGVTTPSGCSTAYPTSGLTTNSPHDSLYSISELASDSVSESK